MVLIGDVHGKIHQYNRIIQKYKDTDTICVGDFGFKREHDWHLKNINNDRHKILYGNHDYYPYLHLNHSLGDFGLVDDHIFYVRGAYSIDRHLRTEGLDWFRDEEIRYSGWDQVIDLYMDHLPDIVVSHECPALLHKKIFKYENLIKSVTAQALDTLFEMHQPKTWIFGHHHKSITEDIEGTKFICLDELETLTI